MSGGGDGDAREREPRLDARALREEAAQGLLPFDAEWRWLPPTLPPAVHAACLAAEHATRRVGNRSGPLPYGAAGRPAAAAEAEIVRELARRVDGGESLAGVVADLRRRRVLGPRGDLMAYQSAWTILQRERRAAGLQGGATGSQGLQEGLPCAP